VKYASGSISNLNGNHDEGHPNFYRDTRFGRIGKKKVVGLERGPLSLVSTTEELLDRKVAAPV
jgi:hypothetical protein